MAEITKETLSEKMANFDKGDVIVLSKESDGNWKGIMTKFGKGISVRDIGPETVLQRLLTSDGTSG